MKKRWSVEYTDEEGDLVIKHVVATEEEMKSLAKELANDGHVLKFHDLSPPLKEFK